MKELLLALLLSMPLTPVEDNHRWYSVQPSEESEFVAEYTEVMQVGSGVVMRSRFSGQHSHSSMVFIPGAYIYQNPDNPKYYIVWGSHR